MSAPPVRPAATVLLLRAGAAGLEVYLVRRHGRSGFMAGAHVFPGGRVDDADRALAERLDPAALAGCALPGIDDGLDSAAFFIAAVRETVEECGVLLARDAGGTLASAEVASAVFEAVQRGEAFADVIAAHGVFPDVGAMAPFAWWITPEAEPKRYDTRFFFAEAPPHQRAGIDAKEVTAGGWMTPEDAVSRYRQGEIFLAPPTLVSLEDLAGVASFDDVVARRPDPGAPVCPLLLAEGEDLVLALPGDPLHAVKDAVWPGRRTRIVRGADGRFHSALS